MPVPRPGRSAAEWLAAAAPDPREVLRRWERNPLDVALLAVGRLWDLVLMPGTIGVPVLDVLGTHAATPTGPALSDTAGTRIGFLTPRGTDRHLFGGRARLVGARAWLVAPHPEVSSQGTRWLVPPDGTGVLTDPHLLARAVAQVSREAALLREASAGRGAGCQAVR